MVSGAAQYAELTVVGADLFGDTTGGYAKLCRAPNYVERIATSRSFEAKAAAFRMRTRHN
jgi:hypothetical protein